jgi:hypothetical protein
MPGNPFEPPKTTDLDEAGDSSGTPFTSSDKALQELIAAAPWVRWTTHLISLSIAVGLVHAIVDLVRSGSATSKGARLFATALGTGVWTLVLIALRRYSTASNRLRSGTPTARGHLIAAQASYFKLVGVLAIIGGALFLIVAALVLLVGGGYMIGRRAVGR